MLYDVQFVNFRDMFRLPYLTMLAADVCEHTDLTIELVMAISPDSLKELHNFKS